MDIDQAQLNAAISEGMKAALMLGALLGFVGSKAVDLAENLYWQWRAMRRRNRFRRMRLARNGASL